MLMWVAVVLADGADVLSILRKVDEAAAGGLGAAVELGDHDGAADIAAKGEGKIDQRHLIGVADCRKRILSDHFSSDQGVRNVIHLLEDHTAEQRKGKIPERLPRWADR